MYSFIYSFLFILVPGFILNYSGTLTIPLPNLQNYHLFFILCILIHSQILFLSWFTFIYPGILHSCSQCTMIAFYHLFFILIYSNHQIYSHLFSAVNIFSWMPSLQFIILFFHYHLCWHLDLNYSITVSGILFPDTKMTTCWPPFILYSGPGGWGLLYCTALHCAALFCTVLYCTVL